jgi:hypothetical protein
MQKFTSLLALFFVLLFTQCGKDKCKTVTCANSGTCKDGTCQCTPGWGGADCSTEVVPKSVNVKSVKITQMPGNKPDGSSWGGNGTDTIYYEVFESANFNKVYASEKGILSSMTFDFAKIYDAAGKEVSAMSWSPDLHYNFIFSYHDDVKVQTISNFEAVPYTAGEKFPTSIKFSNAQGYKGEMAVSYTW